MISGITVLSGDTMTLQLSVACAAVPGLPSLARGKKLPADRLCRAIHVSSFELHLILQLGFSEL